MRTFDPDNDASTDNNETEILMIVEPKDISASINTNYVVSVDSVYTNKFYFEHYENRITESVIVNFFNGATEEQNSYKLISGTEADDITSKNDGLLDASISGLNTE